MQEIGCDCLLFTHSYHQAFPTPRASCNYSCSEVSDRFPPEKTPTECVLPKHIHSASLLLKRKLPVLGQLPGEINHHMAQCKVQDAAESSELQLLRLPTCRACQAGCPLSLKNPRMFKPWESHVNSVQLLTWEMKVLQVLLQLKGRVSSELRLSHSNAEISLLQN